MDISSVTDVPVTRKLNGVDVSFPRLTLDDVEHFGGKLKEDRAKANAALTAKHKLDNWQQFRADQELEHGGVSVSDVLRYLRTAAGVKAGFARLCEAAKHSTEDAARYAKLLGPIEQLELVGESLSAPKLPPQDVPNAGPQSPNE